MRINININGVLRNFIQKFEYYYRTDFIDTDPEDETEQSSFDYKINEPINCENLIGSFDFNSKEEFEFFTFYERPLELFGHSGLSYKNVITELNELVYENPDLQINLIGIDEFGKSPCGSLFFLSRNGVVVDGIKFIKKKNINDEWVNCDLWVTDVKTPFTKIPEGKELILFETEYNKENINENDKVIKSIKEILEYVKK